MAQSPEMQAKLGVWREKARAGTLTQDEMREAIAALREDRSRAVTTQTASKARAKKAVVSSDDLLAELDGL